MGVVCRIGIAGGSLGGLFAGILLHRAGLDVAVFDRPTSGLEGRGTGLVGQREIFTILREVGCERVAQVGVVARERITLDREGHVIQRRTLPDADFLGPDVPIFLPAVARRSIQSWQNAYSYNDCVNFTAERWPTWRQGLEYDAALFFVCYQRGPRTGFINIFGRMAKLDMMNQFVTYVGGDLFACPRGAR